MRKLHKKYSKPRQIFNRPRIEEEDELVKQYGLKNKKEIWKADSEITRIRRKAKNFLRESQEKQEMFLAKLKQKGFAVDSLDDVLSLKIEDLLKRRLQTILFSKRIATTQKQARQFIVHKKVLVGSNIINIPSYVVPLELESKIKLITKVKKEKDKKVEIAQIENIEEKTEGEE